MSIRTASDVADDLEGQLNRFRSALDRLSPDDIPVTVVCLARHGYATTRVCLENLYTTTRTRFVVLYLDVNSPRVVREYLAEQERERENFFHIRIDQYLSRQSARLLVLDTIPTRYTVFIDNNMQFTEGWLEHLLYTSEQDDAWVVSPLIVMQGGAVHFSGSKVEPLGDGFYSRKQTTPKAPMTVPMEDAELEKLEIDFAESHCCLVRTEGFRGRAEELFLEEMNNSHTMAAATQRIRRRYGCRMLIDPESVVSILPVGAGYDIPWMFESYNNLEMFKASYARHVTEAGRSQSTTLSNLHWHRKHLLYLLLTMIEGANLERTDMLRKEEVPAQVRGYDKPLADDTLYRLRKKLAPYVKENYPRYRRPLDMWMYQVNDLVTDIDACISELKEKPRPTAQLGVSLVICTHNGARLLPDTLKAIGSLDNESGREWELIVVDNASTDDTARVVEESCPQNVRARLTLLSEPRLGVAFARLKGLYSARHEIVSFIDDDNWVPEDWLDAVGELMEKHSDIGVVGTYAQPVFETEPPPWFDKVRSQFAVGGQGVDVGDVTWRRGYVWGAGSAYRGAALRAAIERFDGMLTSGRQGQRVLTSGEDTEFCYMLRALDWKVWYDPSIRIRHYIPTRKLTWSYLCRINKGFGAACIALQQYRANWPPAIEKPWHGTWSFAIFQELQRMWRCKKHLLRVLLCRSTGDVSALAVYRSLGRIAALLQQRKRYSESTRSGVRLPREPGQSGSGGGIARA